MTGNNIKETQKLLYRKYQSNDLPAILELWEKFSGWGAITEQQFKEWNFNTPYGDCLIIVAETNAKEIVGQIVFIPSVIYVNCKELKAYRIMAPILNMVVRNVEIHDSEHPIWGLTREGVEEARRNSYSIIYMQPAIGWLRLQKLFELNGLPQLFKNSFGCDSISLLDKETFPTAIAEDYEFGMGEFNSEYDILWKTFVEQVDVRIAVKRDTKWLKWKRGQHLFFEMRHKVENTLKGYIVAKKDSGLILDIVAESEKELEIMLDLFIYNLHNENPAKRPLSLHEIKFMRTPMIKRLLGNKIPDNVNFEFAFGCIFLDAEFEIDYDHFYLMPDD